MSIPFSQTCGNCGAQLTIKKPELIGKQIRCPKCRENLLIPAPSADDDLVQEVDPWEQDDAILENTGNLFEDNWDDQIEEAPLAPKRRRQTGSTSNSRGKKKDGTRKSKRPEESTRPAWIIPAAIGGGVLTLGALVVAAILAFTLGGSDATGEAETIAESEIAPLDIRPAPEQPSPSAQPTQPTQQPASNPPAPLPNEPVEENEHENVASSSPPATNRPAPFRPERTSRRPLTRDGEEVLSDKPPQTVVIGGELVLPFEVELINVEYRFSNGDDPPEGDWQQALSDLQESGDAPRLPLAAAVTAHQNVLFLTEAALAALQKHSLPIPVRIGRERMQVEELDDFQTAARIAREPLGRSWHNVDEAIVVLTGREDNDANYFREGKPWIHREQLFSWRPTAADAGERHLELRWKEKMSPYRGTLELDVLVLTAERSEELEYQRMEAALALDPSAWAPLPPVDDRPPRRSRRLKVGRSVQKLRSLPNDRRSEVPFVEVLPSGTDGTLATNVTEEGSEEPVELELADGTGIPLLELPIAAATAQLSPWTPTQQQPAVALENTGRLIDVRATNRWLPARRQDSPAEPASPPPARCLPTGRGDTFLFLADPQHLLVVDASNATVSGGLATDRRIADVAVCSEGPLLLLAPERFSGVQSTTSGRSIPIAAREQLVDSLSAAQLVLLDQKTLKPTRTWALPADVLAATPDSSQVFAASMHFVASLDVSDGLLTDLDSLPEVTDPLRDRPPQVAMQYLAGRNQLLVHLSSSTSRLVRLQVDEATLSQQEELQLELPNGQLQCQVETPAALFLMNRYLTFLNPTNLGGYSSCLTHPPAAWPPIVAVDPTTKTLLSVYQTRSGPFRSSAASLLIGPFAIDLSTQLPDGESVCALGPGRFLVTSATRQLFVDLKTEAAHWPFDHSARRTWNSSDEEAAPQTPETPAELIVERGDRYASVTASYRTAGWTEDGSAWFSYKFTGRSNTSLHRFDLATRSETHVLKLPYKDASIRVATCPAGVLVIAGAKHRFELYSPADLQPVWNFDDPAVIGVRCSPYHNRIAVTTATDLAVLNAESGEIEHRISRLELLRLSDSNSLVNHKLIPTRDPGLFYLGRNGYGQQEADLFGPVKIEEDRLVIVEQTGNTLLADTRQPDGYEYRFNDNDTKLNIVDASGRSHHTERFRQRIRSVVPCPTDPATALVTVGSRVTLFQTDALDSSR